MRTNEREDKKSNLEKFINSYNKALEEDMTVYKSGVEDDDTPAVYVVINKDKSKAYIVDCDKEGRLLTCNCEDAYYRGYKRKSPKICKHIMKVSIVTNRDILQLGGCYTLPRIDELI